MKKIILSFLSCLFMSLCFAQNDNVLTDELQKILNQKSNDLIDINILLKSQMPTEHLTHLNVKSDSKEVRREIVINELKKFSQQQQESVMSVINAETRSNNVTDIKSHWLVNSINCKASRDVIYTLASHPDIKHIDYNKEEKMFQGEDIELNGQEVRGSVSSLTDNITHVQAEKVWDLGYTGKGVIVAVIDSGVNLDHVDLKDHLWDGGQDYPYHGYNFVNPGQAPYDDKGHGTHCAGTICGDGTSGLATGIAPDATLMCLKTSSKTETSTTFDRLSSAIEFAVEHGADIISLSVGGWINDNVARASFRQIFDNALNLGVITSAAAGNNRQYLTTTLPAPRNINSPSDCPPPWIHPDQQGNGTNVSGVVSVGGVDYENQVISISSQGPTTWQETSYADYLYNPGIGLIRPDIVAPGDGIKSLDYETNDGYAIKSGTSMAAPCVAGVMALMLEKNPELTPADICRIIETTATKLTETKSNDYGSGCINALAAVQAVNFYVQSPYLNQYSFTKNFEALSSNANQNLEITLVNNGTQATAGTTNVTLTSNDEYVTVVNGNASINNSIAVGGTATCNFTININTLSPDNHIAELTVNAGTNYFNIEINISNEFVAPSNVTTEVQNLRNVYLSWNATNNATGYKIYRDGAYVGETSTTSYTDENLDYGTLYTYTITTKRGELETEHSREIRVQTADNPEAPSPTNVVATDNNSSVAISWNNSTGSKGSNIYRKDNIAGTETQIASNVSGNSYTDNISLQEGIYQYGVANLHSEKETIYEEGFENNGTLLPEGWSVYRVEANQNNWGVKESETRNNTTFTPYMGQYAAFSFYGANGYTIKFYLVTPSFDLSKYQGSDVTLSFYYITPAWGTDVNNLNVRIGSSPTGPWNDAIWTSKKTNVTEWTKAEVDITSYIGSTFYIAFENEIGYGICSAVDNVSIAIDGNKESRIEWSDNIYKNVNIISKDGDWNDTDNWATNSIPSESDNVIIDANAVINGTVEVNSLTINEGKSLTLNRGAKLIVNGKFNNNDPTALIINDGAQVVHNSENLPATFNMDIVGPENWGSDNKTGWQFIASPVKDAKINDFIPESSEYDLYKYDGNADFEWINYKDENNYGGDDEPEVPVISIDTVTIGEGTTKNAFIPSNINYDYTITQQIYTAEDLQNKEGGYITSYAFHHAKDLTNGQNTRKFKIYMQNTTKTSFSGGSDWVSMQESDLVFDGSVTYNETDTWVTINFDTPFEYENGKNIILCVYDNTNAWYISTTNYNGTETSDYRAIRVYRDDSPFNVSSVGVTGTAEKFIGNAKFVIESGNGGGGGQEPEDPETPVTPTAPAAPVVTAEATGSTAATLTWEAVDGATSYNVYMLYTGGEYLHGTTTGTSYSVSYLTSGANNCFDVTAVNEVGESERTNVCVLTYPAVPQNLAATANETTITLTWNAVTGAESYNVYSGTETIATGLTGATFTTEELAAGNYCYTVTAVNASSESAASAEACATIAEQGDETPDPEGDVCTIELILSDKYSDGWDGSTLTVSATDGTSEVLTLEKGKKSETYSVEIVSGSHVTITYHPYNSEYNVYPAENSFVVRYQSGLEIYSVAENTLVKGEDHVYEFDVDCAPKAPESPVVKAKATETTIVLTWDAVIGAESYMVYRDAEQLAEGLTERTYTITGLTPKTEYTFSVIAANEVGNSEPTVITAKTKSDNLEVVTIEIGEESGLSTYYSPVYDNYKSYSVSQTIYTSNEIGVTSGTITSISYKNSTGNNNTRNIAVYLKNVDRNNFATKEWETLTSDLCVYDGNFTFGTNDWVTIEFTDEFEYDGGNLLVCVVDKTGAAIYSSYDMFSAYEVSQTESESRAVFGEYKSYGTPINPLDLTNTASTPTYVRTALSGTTYSYRAPLVKFGMEVNTNANSKSATREVSSVSPSRSAFESTFTQGVGYLASYEIENTAVFQGNLNHEKSFEFPVSYNNLKELDLDNFHLLGNPFSFNMKWSNVTVNNLVNGYAVINKEGGYTYHGTADDEIEVGDGFFVKAIGENPSMSYNEGRSRREVEDQSINVVITGNAGSDNVVVKLDHADEEGFPKLKNFNEEITTIFVYNNEKSYGIYNCEEEVEEVPIYLNNTNGMGKFTISIDAKGDFENITLVDLVTGDETNMLVHDYNFTASQQENTKRFILKFVEKQQTIDNSNFVYQSGEELIVNTQGTVQIIDIMGRVVYNNVVLNESERINISGFTTGTYIVRVIGDNDVMTQKVVVY